MMSRNESISIGKSLAQPTSSSKIVRAKIKSGSKNVDKRIFNSSMSTIHTIKQGPIVIPQKSVHLVKADQPPVQKKDPEPDLNQLMLDQIDEMFNAFRSNVNKYTLECDEYQLLSSLDKNISKIDDTIFEADNLNQNLKAQVQENQKLLSSSDYQTISGQLVFSMDDHLLKVERRQVEERLRQDQVDALQAKLEGLESKVLELEDKNYQLRVKAHMKKSDYEQYQEILKPMFGGEEVEIENIDRQKRSLKMNEIKYKEMSIQLQGLQRRGNYELKMQKKRLNDEQIRIEMEIKGKRD